VDDSVLLQETEDGLGALRNFSGESVSGDVVDVPSITGIAPDVPIIDEN